MIAGLIFLLCAFAAVATAAVIVTLKVQCDAEGGWVLIALCVVQIVVNTVSALYAFGVIA